MVVSHPEHQNQSIILDSIDLARCGKIISYRILATMEVLVPLLKIRKHYIERVCLNASIEILKIEIYSQITILEDFIFLVTDERV